MSQAEQQLIFLTGSVTANGTTPVPVSDVRISASSFVMLGLPNSRAGANAGEATVSSVSAGSFSIVNSGADTSVYPYYVITSPQFGGKEQSAYTPQ